MAYIENGGKVALPENTVYTVGKKFTRVDSRVTVLSSAVADDVVILGGGFASESRISRLNSYSFGALTTDCDLGFYKYENGTYVAVDGDVLVDGADLSVAGTVFEDILLKNSSLDRTATIGDLLGKSVEEFPNSGYFLGLKLGGSPVADADLEWEIEVEQPTSK